MIQILPCETEETIQRFLSLPARLYPPQTITGSRSEEEQLLRGTHALSHYFTLTAWVAIDGNTTLGRCALTEYPEDSTAYFGFFECENHPEAARRLIGAVEQAAAEKGCRVLEGPLDASLWIRYRFKADQFHLPPYCGEPYNLPYYQDLFFRQGFSVKETYVSNRYHKLPKTGYAIPKYQKRYEDFLSRGYEIRSPRPEEWDRASREVYRLVSRLYTGFLTYKPITEEEFADYLSVFRPIADFSMIKLAYYEGRAVGFFMGLPNYGNLASRPRTPWVLFRFLSKKIRCTDYVLLYMGVEPEHQGLGKALTHAIMVELSKKRAASIGSLIRNGNVNYNYADQVMEGRYHYVFLEKMLRHPCPSGGKYPDPQDTSLSS